MQKDLKIGMLVGLALVIIAGLWLSTRPSLSTRARILGPREAKSRQAHGAASQHQSTEQPANEHKPTSSEYRASGIENRVTRFHVVQKGQTLSAISSRYYGSANQWPKIRDANPSTIKDADKLVPGTKLIIPD